MKEVEAEAGLETLRQISSAVVDSREIPTLDNKIV
jgi:hypothetical protein